MKLLQMGQWATNRGLAECVELEGFGIIGAVIDTEGNGIVLHQALAAHDLLVALRLAKYYVEFAIETGDQQAPKDLAAVCAAIAKAEGKSA